MSLRGPTFVVAGEKDSSDQSEEMGIHCHYRRAWFYMQFVVEHNERAPLTQPQWQWHTKS
eukprot:1151750-Pelagomonas_calceolata.AAC.13